jgi:probable addiction module antidote protein
MHTGKTTKPASPSRSFNAATHLRNEAEVAAYIEAMLEDGDARAVPVALRTVADAVGGMTALADKTGLSRETLYRTLSERGNPRLDTRCYPGGLWIAPDRNANTQVSCTPKGATHERSYRHLAGHRTMTHLLSDTQVKMCFQSMALIRRSGLDPSNGCRERNLCSCSLSCHPA